MRTQLFVKISYFLATDKSCLIFARGALSERDGFSDPYSFFEVQNARFFMEIARFSTF